LEKRELEKAERMASKAIELEKDNATYIDTYAWVLFQQQKYAEAKVYIDQVLNIVGKEPDKDDATLIEHAGDIYSQCGFKDKALEYWKQAQGLGVKSKTLERKIKKKKYIE
jgi:tetratricopeptide (TPR) repeat protein